MPAGSAATVSLNLLAGAVMVFCGVVPHGLLLVGVLGGVGVAGVDGVVVDDLNVTALPCCVALPLSEAPESNMSRTGRSKLAAKPYMVMDVATTPNMIRNI